MLESAPTYILGQPELKRSLIQDFESAWQTGEGNETKLVETEDRMEGGA